MREKPRDGAETPQAQYEKLLKQGIAVQKEYESLNARVGKLYDDGKEDEAEELGEEREQLEDSMTNYMRQRVELIRTIENLKTIEDAFPRVRTVTKEERKEVDAAELIRLFNAGKIGQDDLRAAGEQMRSNEPEDLSDKEMKAYATARAELAVEMGYEKPSKGEGWFEAQRNGVSFSMKHFAFPSDYGITGNDRISKIGVSVMRGKTTESVMYYDRGWDSACTDPEVQREIDRALAIFG
ncbi:MAG TPA: hypothetical protein VJ276_17970 [Thermoanaerobaculia bacterium]|nr:hypothetical protein [Thermoanaerobaculia bacterium]